MLKVHQLRFIYSAPIWYMPWLMLLLGLGCESDPEHGWNHVAFASREQVASSVDTLVSKVKPLERIRARCLDSQGRWSSELMSCLCPPHQLFNVDMGCQILSLSQEAHVCASQFSTLPRSQVEQCIDSLFKMPTFDASISLAYLTDAEIKRLMQKLDEDVVSVFPGVAFFSERKNKSAHIMVQKLDELTLNPYLRVNVIDMSLGMGWMFASPVLTPHVPVFNPNVFVESCKEALKNFPSGLEYAQIHENICEAIAAISTHVVHTPLGKNHKLVSSRYTEEGQDCFNSCAVTMSLQRDDSVVRYHILMHGYVPIIRVIDAVASSGSKKIHAYAFLSPMGKFEALIAKHTRANPPEDAFFISAYECSFNDNFDVLTCRDEVGGKKDIWTKILENKLTFYNNHLPTDGRNAPVQERVHGLIIDNGMDIRVPGLPSRLHVNQHAVSQYLKTKTFHHNIISYPWHVLGHTIDMVDGRHGSAMASVVAADLPHIKLDFISAREVCLKGDDPQWSEKWISYIKERGARVVNMSIGLSHCLTKCEALVGRMFQALPEVLFVVAVGNSGVRDPIMCPASIGPLYPNVLTVAGVDEEGQLHGFSNAGRQVAMVAAPFRGSAIYFKSEDPLDIRVEEIEGTSLSAAQVSNAALRLVARKPFLKPEHLINLFMAACKNDPSIDVACGGSIDFKHIETLVSNRNLRKRSF